jgi:hypothetical protein
VTFGIGLAIAFVIGTAIGMVDHNRAFTYDICGNGVHGVMVNKPIN